MRSPHTTEVCGVRILDQSPIDIINIYRPPIRATNDEREDRFDPRCLPVNRQTLLVGDVNAHHPAWDRNCDLEDAVGDRLDCWLEDVGWSPLNSGDPTLISYRTGGQSAPDLAACGPELAVRTRWSLGPDLGSDHLPMVIEIRGVSDPPQRRRKTRWAHHRADWKKFSDSCEEALREAPPEELSTQQLYTRFSTALQTASKAHIPKGARRDPKPWALHPEVQRAVEERRAARREVHDPESKARWLEAKRRAAEVTERVTQQSYRDFVSTELNQSTSVGRVSRLLKKWEGAEDDEQRDGEAMRVGNRLLVTAEEKANAFAHQYATVSRQVRAPKIDRATRRRTQQFDHYNCADCQNARTGCCSPFSEEELVLAIQRTQLRKSPGPDNITPEMIKHLGPVARGALLKAINRSWKTGEVPREWRAATIVPIPKANKDKKLLANYRPIALTSCNSWNANCERRPGS
ncbi:LINE-1 reverse transcriptase [Amphibalanus amphitrite]|uniref:LINE-1 reverse transcriptase n=1 Tax=Amphibalanus amphitrite TaxID=1232801 RepID=A0A6A4WQ58_AMPAM|nr:LINE-1 reverse transcriptase [Amphibalanus amphitrite]